MNKSHWALIVVSACSGMACETTAPPPEPETPYFEIEVKGDPSLPTVTLAISGMT